MHAVSQLPGRGSTDVDDVPAPIHVNQKSDYDDYLSLFRSFEVVLNVGSKNKNKPFIRGADKIPVPQDHILQ